MMPQAVTHSLSAAAPAGVSGWIKRHRLLTFFGLAYGLTWIPIAFVLVATQLGFLSSNSSVSGIVSQLIVFGPAIAAVMVTATVDGRAGVASLLRRLAQWRVGGQWYLVALVGVPVVLVLGASLLFAGAPLRATADQWQTILVRYLPVVIITALTTGLGEETGWRGFALPHLQGKYGALAGTLALGLVWGLWHLPNAIFFHWDEPTLALFLLETLLDGFVLTWVYNNTRGSLLLVMLLHGAQNTAAHVISTLIPTITALQMYSLYALTMGVCVLLIVIVTRGQLGYRPAADGAQANLAGGK